jgi:hypothetical protein
MLSQKKKTISFYQKKKKREKSSRKNLHNVDTIYTEINRLVVSRFKKKKKKGSDRSTYCYTFITLLYTLLDHHFLDLQVSGDDRNSSFHQ